jgi:hypothetical protein
VAHPFLYTASPKVKPPVKKWTVGLELFSTSVHPHSTKIPPEAPIDGTKAKLSKRLGANFLMNGESKTENRASTFLNFLSNCVPFTRGIKRSDVPAENLPIAIIHKQRYE